MAFLRCPAQFWEISIWKFSAVLVFEPHAHTNVKPFFFFFFFFVFMQVMGAFVFLGCLYRTYLSEKKSQGWCISNIVSKNNIRIHCIERGMANLPLWQRLGWPSSYNTCFFLGGGGMVLTRYNGWALNFTEKATSGKTWKWNPMAFLGIYTTNIYQYRVKHKFPSDTAAVVAVLSHFRSPNSQSFFLARKSHSLS